MSSSSESSTTVPWWADRQLVLFVVTAVSAGVAAGATAAVTATLVPYGLAAFLGGYRSSSARRKEVSATGAATAGSVGSSAPRSSAAANAVTTATPTPASTVNPAVPAAATGGNSRVTVAPQPSAGPVVAVRSSKSGRESSKKKSSSSSSSTGTGSGSAWLTSSGGGGSSGSSSGAAAVSVLAGREGKALRDAVMSGMVMPKDIEVTRESFPYHLSDSTWLALLHASFLRLQRPDLHSFTADLQAMSPRILLTGPPGSECYQERLVEALARHLNVRLLVFDLQAALVKHASELRSLRAKAAAGITAAAQPRVRLTDSDSNSNTATAEGGGSSDSSSNSGDCSVAVTGSSGVVTMSEAGSGEMSGEEQQPLMQRGKAGLGGAEESGIAARGSEAAGLQEGEGNTSGRDDMREGRGKEAEGVNGSSDALVRESNSVDIGDGSMAARDMEGARGKQASVRRGRRVKFSGLADEEEMEGEAVVGGEEEERDVSSEEEIRKEKAAAKGESGNRSTGEEGADEEEGEDGEKNHEREAAHLQDLYEEAEKLKSQLLAMLPPSVACAASQQVPKNTQDTLTSLRSPAVHSSSSAFLLPPTSTSTSTSQYSTAQSTAVQASSAAALPFPPAAVFPTTFECCLPRTGEPRLNSSAFSASVPVETTSRLDASAAGQTGEREGSGSGEGDEKGKEYESPQKRGEGREGEGIVQAAVRVLEGNANGESVSAREGGGEGKEEARSGRSGGSKAGAVAGEGEKATGGGSGEGKSKEKENKAIEAAAGSTKRRPLKKGDRVRYMGPSSQPPPSSSSYSSSSLISSAFLGLSGEPPGVPYGSSASMAGRAPTPGSKGRVILTIDEAPRRVGVRFDRPFSGGHTLLDLCEDQHGYFCNVSDLKLEGSPTDDWDKQLLDALGEIIMVEGKGSPLIVFLRGADRLALTHFDRLCRLERIDRQEGMRHVVIASHATEAKKEKGSSSSKQSATDKLSALLDLPYLDLAPPSRSEEDKLRMEGSKSLKLLSKVFPTRIPIHPPSDERKLKEWSKKMEEDSEGRRAEANRQRLRMVMNAAGLDCEGLDSVDITFQALTQEASERIVAWGMSHQVQQQEEQQQQEQQEGQQQQQQQQQQEQQEQQQEQQEVQQHQQQQQQPDTQLDRLTLRAESLVHSAKVVEEVQTPPPSSRKSLKDIACDNDFEKQLLGDVIPADELGVSFDMIGALEPVKETLREVVMLPLQRPELFRKGQLLKPVRGLLLFGPPGTGKTMLAKAVATESGANFVNVAMSSIGSKWFGEAEKFVKAVFTLASKISPCVIFIDEVDSMLGKRGKEAEHSAMRKVKNEFMAAWDGLRTKEAERILVLAATNRPFDLDEAVVRRFPRRLFVDLPDALNRAKILEVILSEEDVVEGFSIEAVAADTNGYSGSDLRNLCVTAAFIRVREFLDHERARKNKSISSNNSSNAGSTGSSSSSQEQTGRSKVDSGSGGSTRKDLSSNGAAAGNGSSGEVEDGSSKVKNGSKDRDLDAGAEKRQGDAEEPSFRPITNEDFKKAMEKVRPSVSENDATMMELMEWNEMFGEGASRRLPPLSYFM